MKKIGRKRYQLTTCTLFFTPFFSYNIVILLPKLIHSNSCVVSRKITHHIIEGKNIHTKVGVQPSENSSILCRVWVCVCEREIERERESEEQTERHYNSNNNQNRMLFVKETNLWRISLSNKVFKSTSFMLIVGNNRWCENCHWLRYKRCQQRQQ